ncbi:TPA: hypothetical protein KRE78_002564 [Clostridioides difficile]|nr:hypothetical protein [Clostridioides difficile]
MADIKTHLRELGVGLAVHSHVNKYNIDFSSLTPREFFNMCKNVFSNDISVGENILSLDYLTDDNLSIIKNSFDLGELIINKIPSLSSSSIYYWFGCDTQKNDPIDLQIDEFKFSLKEDSFILKNMGLYSFLNLLTNSSYKRGLHVFKTFALNEYSNWFDTTWSKLLNYLDTNGTWVLSEKGRTSSISIENDLVKLSLNDEYKLLPRNSSLDDFERLTNSKIREKVFSKWINLCISKDEDYLNSKNICSNVAGANLVRQIQSNLTLDNMPRFLQVYDFEYYYAKSDNLSTTLLKVPSLSTFNSTFEISNIRYSIPSSQLNIETTIKNLVTEKTLTLRNECRFSHGQLNGTPEAKMYYSSDSDLSVIYECL